MGREVYPTTESGLTAQWIDKRTVQRREAAKVLEISRRQFLWSAAHKSRAEALAMGSARYIGRPCKHGHSGERYANHGGCVACATEGAERRRRRRGAPIRGPRPQARHSLRSATRAAA